MRIFLDTNILLDVLSERKPHYAAAAALWTLAETRKVDARISALSFSNVYYILCRLSDRKKAEQGIRILFNLFTVAPVEEKIIGQAIDSNFRDFEDAIQYFCAVQSKTRFFITRNSRDFPQERMSILTAAEFLALRQINSD